MGGGSSKKAKQLTSEEKNEAEKADESLKAKITGQIKKGDYNDFYCEDTNRVQALGSGMSGSVHQYMHRITKSPVAIKSVRKRGLHPGLCDDMKQEIQLLAQLDHPNIVKILEAFDSDSAVTLVMEVCTGGELYDNLVNSKTGNYNQGVAAKVFKQMVEAVGYCHKMGVAHRDLKLENFIFETREPNSPIKLIDFGLSKKYSAGGVQRMKSLVGTAYYMAPEVLNPTEEYGNKCDVWSLGVILFMMLTGAPPFDGDTDYEIMENIKSHDIGFDNNDWIAPGMADAKKLILNMLKVDQSKRYSCDEVLASKWMQTNTKDTGEHEAISDKVVKSFYRYGNMEKLKQTAVQVVAYTLSPQEIANLRNQFKAFDVDGSGTVSIEEFRKGMESTGSINPADIDSLFNKIDTDSTGLISYSEFISATLTNSDLLTKDRLSAAFDRLDPDGSGFIDASELKNLLADSVSEEEISKMIADADKFGDGDHQISREEFLNFWDTSYDNKKILQALEQPGEQSSNIATISS